jgi:hypothetical protein
MRLPKKVVFDPADFDKQQVVRDKRYNQAHSCKNEHQFWVNYTEEISSVRVRRRRRH